MALAKEMRGEHMRSGTQLPSHRLWWHVVKTFLYGSTGSEVQLDTGHWSMEHTLPAKSITYLKPYKLI